MADLASTEPGAMAMMADETSPPKDSSIQRHQVADDTTGDHTENPASPHHQPTSVIPENSSQPTMNLGPTDVNADGHTSQGGPPKNPASTHEEPTMNKNLAGVNQSDSPQPEPQDESDALSDTCSEKSLDVLSDLCSENSLEVLEASANVGVALLRDLREPIAGLGTETGQEYLNSVDKISQSVKKTRFVVGVVGNTGAGKSSIINAVLDEERLLPTNCLRACTASPTEISYNYSEDPAERYRAEVEFISADSWVEELEILYGDMLDGDGGISNSLDNEAKIALAKLHAVYPGKTKADLTDCEPEDLACDHSVRDILGTTKSLCGVTAEDLYGKIQVYVDSKEKSRTKKSKGKDVASQPAAPVPMEFWPLIKAVRIFTKASALETGTVLVDLPGVQDSNAARAAVAERYMKECSALFILAPITRAVDDKTARKLLGEGFRRQLKFDGAYSAITFICSKTDDISVSEAVESLELHEEMAELRDLKDKIGTKLQIANEAIETKTRDRHNLSRKLEELDDEIDTWEHLAEQNSIGSKVYLPSSRKRKRLANPSGARKNMSSPDSDDEGSGSDTENEEEPEKSEPLDGHHIAEKIFNLRLQSKGLRASKKSLASEIDELRININDLTAHQNNLDMEVAATCIQGRNEYARDVIQQDFARGIQELDQEAMFEKDEESFDPDLEVKDYEALGRALPVFCVSARAYQYLCGRLKKDKLKARGFADKKATDIPCLQDHVRTLSSAARASQCRHFLSELAQIINSMRIWTAPQQMGQDDSETQDIQDLLDRKMQQLHQSFLEVVQECVDSINRTFSERIIKRVEKMQAAASSAVETARAWGEAKSPGGMYYPTYKATARRKGVFNGAAGPKNLNMDLLNPIMGSLAPTWEDVFGHRVPMFLDKFTRDAQAAVREFHNRMCQDSGISSTTALLNKQLPLYVQNMNHMLHQVKDSIAAAQRDANRSMEPVITAKMVPAYTACVVERGPGSYLRMKKHMEDHVRSAGDEMFKEVSKVLDERLKQLVNKVASRLKRATNDTLGRVCRDYKSALLENRAETLSEVANILSGVNARFMQSTSTSSAPELESSSITQDELKGGEDDSGDTDIKMELTE
ncbi:hypothetical protein RB595_006242 [Gaeumannomyces hyphopodioides]